MRHPPCLDRNRTAVERTVTELCGEDWGREIRLKENRSSLASHSSPHSPGPIRVLSESVETFCITAPCRMKEANGKVTFSECGEVLSNQRRWKSCSQRTQAGDKGEGRTNLARVTNLTGKNIALQNQSLTKVRAREVVSTPQHRHG